MAKAATRERILETALALFSVQGYEATSVAEIASAVGIRKASLYSHFACKQDILDSLLQSIMAHYETHSIFTKADWTNTAFLAEMERLTEDAMIRTILAQVRFSGGDKATGNVLPIRIPCVFERKLRQCKSTRTLAAFVRDCEPRMLLDFRYHRFYRGLLMVSHWFASLCIRT